ncbi:unnamed protein product [Owenia fusiformis]|uniref:G-protein coupled receptors family 2 profile 2 domain-containing protein n=1 Tax=Owenia fusiformis TaxID=6347 RepID=A0A8S4N2F0_OWEFU|nr:unnamed protein product [Owenia fusiformis]
MDKLYIVTILISICHVQLAFEATRETGIFQSTDSESAAFAQRDGPQDVLDKYTQCRATRDLDFGAIEVVTSCPSNDGVAMYGSNNMLCNNPSTSGVLTAIPVTGQTGIVFRNYYCALCHGETLASFWEVDMMCKGLPHITETPHFSVKPSELEEYLEGRCTMLSMDPPSWTYIKQCKSSTPTTKSIHKRQLNGNPFFEIGIAVASFSILMNFGIDGKAHILLGTQEDHDVRHLTQCNSEEIYDPFKETCRTVLCAHDFVPIDGKCVPKLPIAIAPSASEAENVRDRTRKQRVYLVMNMLVQVQYEMYAILLHGDYTELIAQGLSALLDVAVDRISNIIVHPADFDRTGLNASPNKPIGNNTNSENKTLAELRKIPIAFVEVKITFSLGVENNHKSIDAVIEKMNRLIEDGLFELDLGALIVKVTGVEEHLGGIVPKDDTWCVDGMRRLYLDKEFDIGMSDGNRTNIYIHETDTLYEHGDFDLTLCVKGEYWKEDISGFVFVCEKVPMIVNDACARIELDSDDNYEILPNRSIVLSDTMYDLDSYQFTINGSVVICVPPDYYKTKTNVVNSCIHSVTFAYFDIIQRYLTLIFKTVSIVSIFITIVTYTIFKKLRNLPGCNVLNLAVALFFAELFFLLFGGAFVKEHIICSIVAIVIHYMFLSAFFWMNTMAYDMYCTFASKQMTVQLREKTQYWWRYMLYSWGSPLLICLACVIIEYTKMFPSVRIGYGRPIIDMDTQTNITKETTSDTIGIRYGCWIREPLATLIVFGGPITLICVTNTILFIFTIFRLRQNSKFNRSLKSKNRRKFSESSVTSVSSNDVMLYLRMSSFMGFTWIFGIASSVVSGLARPTEPICYLLYTMNLLFIIFNCLQGVFLFVAFVCNRKVIKLYKDLFSRVFCKQQDREGGSFSHRKLSKRDSNISIVSLSTSSSSVFSDDSSVTITSFKRIYVD